MRYRACEHIPIAGLADCATLAPPIRDGQDSGAMSDDNACATLAAAIEKVGTGYLVVVTGAGVSLASGIPTFRGTDPGAVWKRDVTELGTNRYFEEDPAGSWSWYTSRFDIVLDKRPNPAHLALAAIERWQAGRGGRFLLRHAERRSAARARGKRTAGEGARIVGPGALLAARLRIRRAARLAAAHGHRHDRVQGGAGGRECPALSVVRCAPPPARALVRRVLRRAPRLPVGTGPRRGAVHGRVPVRRPRRSRSG